MAESTDTSDLGLERLICRAPGGDAYEPARSLLGFASRGLGVAAGGRSERSGATATDTVARDLEQGKAGRGCRVVIR